MATSTSTNISQQVSIIPTFKPEDGDPLSKVDLGMVIAIEERRLLLELLEKVVKCKAADLFLEPVTEEEAPGYFSVISQPMDLTTLKGMIESGAVGDLSSFKDKIELMVTNCKTFNEGGVSSSHPYTRLRLRGIK